MRLWVLLFILILGLANTASGQDFNPKRIYQKASKAVALIVGFDRGKESASTGTGSIISEDGLILTNAHVIYNDEKGRPFDSIRIFLKPDRVTGNMKNDTSRKFRAKVAHYSSPLDLAILKIDDPQFSRSLYLLELSNLTETSIGDPVLAIGHPEQGGLWTLTTGTISSLIEGFNGTPGKDVFQTETSINRGNSGGPLIDRHGHLVGVNSMIARQGEGGITITDINFSIKSTVAMEWMHSVGYSQQYAKTTPQTVDTHPEYKTLTEKAGIVPVPTQQPKPAEIKPEPKQQPLKEPEILTEVHPYEEKDLFEQVEDEMEDMMRDMKGKIRRR
ncbi:MAG: serine protease [Nitrospinae bacterium CG11_big_fil_rev_8_21_14_0_20_45_15]|nr:MAG: serine protease [Nitrospinae bacterium CG11_big_fil_rev_8_21_14_0_20_45_15]